MLTVAKRLWQEEQGQSMVEYGLVLALVAIVAVAALMTFGDIITETFNKIVKVLKNKGTETS